MPSEPRTFHFAKKLKAVCMCDEYVHFVIFTFRRSLCLKPIKMFSSTHIKMLVKGKHYKKMLLRRHSNINVQSNTDANNGVT